MRDPWLLIVIGALLVAVPIGISRWEARRAGKPGGLRDRVQAIVRSEPTTMVFIAGVRIGIEIAGVILVAIGAMRALGVAV